MHAQSCLPLCDPMDCSLPGSSICGILQARILEWVAISSSRESSLPRDRTHVSCTSRLILYHLPLYHLEITFVFCVYFCFVYKFICIIFFKFRKHFLNDIICNYIYLIIIASYEKTYFLLE